MALNTAGAIDRRQGRWKEAVGKMQKAQELDPRNLSVIWNLGNVHRSASIRRGGRRNHCGPRNFSQRALLLAGTGGIAAVSKGRLGGFACRLNESARDFDPGGAVTTIAFRASLMARDYDEGSRLLAACSHQKLNDNGLSGIAAALDGYTVPLTWYIGLIERGRGAEGVALEAFHAARRSIEADVTKQPEDAKSVAMLVWCMPRSGTNTRRFATPGARSSCFP